MDIKDYISSGILEQYVLNSASAQERQEVECMSHIYPEIKVALTELQTAIENYTEANAVTPPIGAKEKFLTAIKSTSQDKAEPGKVIPIGTTAANKESKEFNKYGKLAIAASICLLVGLGFTYLTLNGKVNELSADVASLETQNNRLNSDNLNLSSTVDSLSGNATFNQALLADLSSFDTKKIQLGGTDLSPESKVNVFWNATSKNVYMKVDDLPEHTDDKQYQLWAIVDGTPTDMGVFDLALAANLQQMPYVVENAQAFAITLEEKGGVQSPTLSELYVIGNV